MLDSLHRALLAALENTVSAVVDTTCGDFQYKGAEAETIVENALFVSSMLESIKSPIERLMLCSMTCIQSYGEYARLCANEDQGHKLVIIPQAKIGKWTADFLIVYRLERPVLIAVECDGHDFHERTKEQAKHDRSRDRAFLAKGIKTVRFTGSEIFADANGCASEIEGLLHNEFDAQFPEWKAA